MNYNYAHILAQVTYEQKQETICYKKGNSVKPTVNSLILLFNPFFKVLEVAYNSGILPQFWTSKLIL